MLETTCIEYNQYQNSGLHTMLKCFNVELLSKFSKDLSDYICEEKNITFSITEPEVIIETKDETVEDDTKVDYLTILETGIKKAKFKGYKGHGLMSPSETYEYYRIEDIEEFEKKWMKSMMHTTFDKKSTSLKVELEYINKVINACNISQKFMDEQSIPESAAAQFFKHGFTLGGNYSALEKKVNDKLEKFKLLKKNVTDKLHKMKKKQTKSKITIKKKKKSVQNIDEWE